MDAANDHSYRASLLGIITFMYLLSTFVGINYRQRVFEVA